MRTLLVALWLLAVLPAAAQAASARVDVYREPAGTDPFSSCSRYNQCPLGNLVYTAGAGEANDVSITSDSGGLRVHDAGATIEPGTNCRRVSAQTVLCVADGVESVKLGDRDDRISAPAVGVLGGDGNDVLDVTSGDGGAGDDIVTCNAAARGCILNGGPGSDRVTGGPDFDTITGGPGDDLLDGGAGFDVVSFFEHTAAVDVDLASIPQRATSPGENDSLAGFEGALGGSGDDVIEGAAGVTIPSAYMAIAGGAGNDVITVRSPMTVLGNDGDDTLIGSPGRDVLEGGNGRDTIRAGAGNDRISGGSGADVLLGQSGDDIISGRDGRLGNDRLSCGPGQDRASADRRDRVVGCDRVRRPRR